MDEQRVDDAITMAECTRWLYRVLKDPTVEDRCRAAAHLLDELSTRFDDEPGTGFFGALAERFGLPAVPRAEPVEEPTPTTPVGGGHP